ncbi:MAG: DnaA regulatory inactivator HdaA [Alphaproteobacteria bacterium]
MREPNRPRQLPLALSHVAGNTRDDLVVSPANAEAVALVDRWPDWPAPLLLLAGPSGSGKSHLGNVWREQSAAICGDPGHIGEETIEAARTNPVFLDDADARHIDEEGLFHLINAARGGGQQLLLTARRFPAAWGVRLPDLASRLKAAATVEIREPDDLLLAGVITKLFADRQVEVDRQVVQFLVRRIERSLATAIRVVERLDRAALEQKSRITRPLAAGILDALDLGQGEFDL